jgi:hypothetical protein
MVSYKYNLKEGLAFLNADDLLDEIFWFGLYINKDILF